MNVSIAILNRGQFGSCFACFTVLGTGYHSGTPLIVRSLYFIPSFGLTRCASITIISFERLSMLADIFIISSSGSSAMVFDFSFSILSSVARTSPAATCWSANAMAWLLTCARLISEGVSDGVLGDEGSGTSISARIHSSHHGAPRPSRASVKRTRTLSFCFEVISTLHPAPPFSLQVYLGHV